MRDIRLLAAIIAAVATSFVATAGNDYSQGFWVVNEDWYGHQNSTINHLDPDNAAGDYWSYRVFQTENPGCELGCTAQYGAIHHGLIYIISKQAKDPGASISGGRITVAEASTMQMVYQCECIDASGAVCDGRAFVGIDEHKGYISTSNGVWVFDIDAMQVTSQIEGTANPDASALYQGQCGSMVYTDGRVFVAHQSKGLLVIDAASDAVIAELPMDIVADDAGIGSVVKARDGMLYVSVAADTQGLGDAYRALLRVNPATLATEVLPLPDDVYPPANSWYAWTPDGFCASATDDALYWNGGESSWFAQSKVFRYDITTNQASLIVDFDNDPDGWMLYGCSMRPHPVSGELYMSLFHGFSDPTYIMRRCSSDGATIKDYPMISNYWFPSIPVFHEAQTGGVDDVSQSHIQAISLINNALRVCGHAGEMLSLRSLSGVVVAQTTIDNDIYDYAIGDDVAAGIYIVTAGNQSRKVALYR